MYMFVSITAHTYSICCVRFCKLKIYIFKFAKAYIRLLFHGVRVHRISSDKHTKPRKTISATLPLRRAHLMNHRHAVTMPSKRSTNIQCNAWAAFTPDQTALAFLHFAGPSVGRQPGPEGRAGPSTGPVLPLPSNRPFAVSLASEPVLELQQMAPLSASRP
jgi:hypothetical protein